MNENYGERVGKELDVFENVVSGGPDGETISHRVARGQKAGHWFPCLFCWWLSVTVEKDHCPHTLAGIPISKAGAVRAGIQLLLLFLFATGAFWRVAFHFIR